MLTDIFARRYETVPLFSYFGEAHRRLMVQSVQLIEQIVPYYHDGKEYEYGKQFWKQAHDLMAREIGLNNLSNPILGFYDANKNWVSHHYHIADVSKNWMLEKFDGSHSPDSFIKERLSFVEIAFQTRGATISEANNKLPALVEQLKQFESVRELRKGGITLPGSRETSARALNANMNAAFQAAVDELNGRLRQAGCDLHYHNGFIQIATDDLITSEIAAPFWALVADSKWKNVDHDLKEAIDLRDTGGRDPAFYAAKALESTIKIISDEKKLTTGNEKGPHNYIDNLRRGNIVDVWEVDTLKLFFTKLRNPFGHGPGSNEMPILSTGQTTWAIQASMSWITSLILRG